MKSTIYGSLIENQGNLNIGRNAHISKFRCMWKY